MISICSLINTLTSPLPAGVNTSAQCNNDFGGPRPFSAPETRSVARFLTRRKSSITSYLSLHSYGQLILIPWGYTKRLPADFDDMVT